MSVRHFENAACDVELAPGRRLDRAAPEVNNGVTAGHSYGEIGVADCRQTRERPERRPAGFDVDGQAIVRRRRPVMLEILQRRVAGNDQSLDGAAEYVIFHPRADVGGCEYRP